MKDTPEQIFAILQAVRTKPAWPSAEVPGLDSFNGQHQAEKLRLFEDLHSRGLLQFVPGPNGKRTGLGYQLTPKGAAERDLLQRRLGVKKL
jgi:hypothetical protein